MLVGRDPGKSWEVLALSSRASGRLGSQDVGRSHHHTSRTPQALTPRFCSRAASRSSLPSPGKRWRPGVCGEAVNHQLVRRKKKVMTCGLCQHPWYKVWPVAEVKALVGLNVVLGRKAHVTCWWHPAPALHGVARDRRAPDRGTGNVPACWVGRCILSASQCWGLGELLPVGR